MNRDSGVSIIICCYNSEKVITETLEHIVKQRVDDDLKWEVILVNNASTDSTVKTAKQSWNDNACKTPFKIINQPLPGRSNALKKGIKKSQFEFVLNCDDDNLLDENYLQTAYEIMKNNPRIGFLGGQGFPQTEGDLPNWFDEFKNLYACGAQSKNENDITYQKGYVYGAGSVFRKSVFDDLNADDYLKVFPGRRNGNLTGGEDNLMGYLAVIGGYKIWYSDRLTFRHVITQDRLRWNYLTNLKYSNGKSQIHLDSYTNYIKNNRNPEGFVKQTLTNFKHILSLVKNNGFDLIKNKEGNYKHLILYYYLGKIKELLRLNFSYKKEYQKSIRYCEFVEEIKSQSVEANVHK